MGFYNEDLYGLSPLLLRKQLMPLNHFLMSAYQNSASTYTELGMKVLGIKSTSPMNKTQRKMTIIKATTRRILSLNAFPPDLFWPFPGVCSRHGAEAHPGPRPSFDSSNCPCSIVDCFEDFFLGHLFASTDDHPRSSSTAFLSFRHKRLRPIRLEPF